MSILHIEWVVLTYKLATFTWLVGLVITDHCLIFLCLQVFLASDIIWLSKILEVCIRMYIFQMEEENVDHIWKFFIWRKGHSGNPFS